MFLSRPPCVGAAVLALTALASCSTSRNPIPCSTESECPSASKCVLGYCVAGALPRAQIELRTGGVLSTHRPIVFEGSSSEDPNPDGAIAAYEWQVKRGPTAHCDPTPAHGSEQTLNTVFTCEGDYEVDLIVKNTLGLKSEPASLTVAVDASSSPPEITGIGPDLKLAHECARTPSVCRAVTADEDKRDEFQLTVDATDVQSGSVLSYEWEYEAPEGVDASAVSVRFEPDSHSRSPLVHIESQGARIAGEWTFTVRVTDSIGLVTPAQQKVTIGNAPPNVNVHQNPFVAPHKFQEGYYFANAAVVADVDDPEDDEIAEVDLRLVEDSPSGCPFRLIDKTLKDGTLSIGFELTAARGQEKQFIGPARQLAVVVRDVNGGETIANVPFEIQNLPPEFHWRQGMPRVEPPSGAGVSGVLPVKHTVESCDEFGSCYIARFVNPLEASDPEGDPLDGLEPTADGLDTDSRFDPQGCSVATSTRHPMKFSGTDGLSPFTLEAHARDPWTTSPDEPSARFRLRTNTGPLIMATGGRCVVAEYSEADRAYHGTATVAAVFSSDDDQLRLIVDDPNCTVTFDAANANPHGVVLSCRAVTLPFVRSTWISVFDYWSSAATLVSFRMGTALFDCIP